MFCSSLFALLRLIWRLSSFYQFLSPASYFIHLTVEFYLKFTYNLFIYSFILFIFDFQYFCPRFISKVHSIPIFPLVWSLKSLKYLLLFSFMFTKISLFSLWLIFSFFSCNKQIFLFYDIFFSHICSTFIYFCDLWRKMCLKEHLFIADSCPKLTTIPWVAYTLSCYYKH